MNKIAPNLLLLISLFSACFGIWMQIEGRQDLAAVQWANAAAAIGWAIYWKLDKFRS